MLIKTKSNNKNTTKIINKKFYTLNKYLYKEYKWAKNDNESNPKYINLVFKNSMVLTRKFNIIKTIINSNLRSMNIYNKEIIKYNSIYTLSLNFKRNRFFPCFNTNVVRETIFNNSLGIISKRFSNKKSYLKSKSSYLISSSYVRRILIYLNTKRTWITISKTPKFLKDVINALTTNSNSVYKNPFTHNDLINEKETNPIIYFEYITFINNKALGPIKKKKKGRLKRKVSKKVVSYNNILD